MTDTMPTWARKRVKEPEMEGLWGFISKSKSPSSGMKRVKVPREDGTPVKKRPNLLQHMMGYFKKLLAPDEKQGLLEVIRDYHEGPVLLIAPMTLFKHYIRKYHQPYL